MEFRRLVEAVVGLIFAGIFAVALYPEFAAEHNDVVAQLNSNTTAPAARQYGNLGTRLVALSVGIGVAAMFIYSIARRD